MAGNAGETSGESGGFGIPDVLKALRYDIEQSQKNLLDANKKPVMKLASGDVEIAFTVESKGKGKVGVNLKVFGVGFEAGGEKERTTSTVHRLRLKLEPSDGTTSGILGILGELEDGPDLDDGP
jgi:Trypsin-co-occurring domain 2